MSVLLSCQFFTTNLQAKEFTKQPKKEGDYWYDGKRKRKLFIDSDRWVKFSNSKSVVSSSSDRKQMLEKRLGHAKIYNQSKGGFQTKSLTPSSMKVATIQNGAAYSEVFNSQGQTKTLPRGIIISFKSDWDEERIQQWADEQNLSVKGFVIEEANIWLIDSPSSIASLNLTNQITDQGEVNYTKLMATINY